MRQPTAIRRTRLYDLAAAAPLIAWYLYCAAHILPSVNQQVAMVILFLRTDPSVLPATLLLSTLSHICTLLFFAVLVILFSIRCVPQLTTSGFYPRCVALIGTFLGVGILLLSPQELSRWPYLASLLLIIGGTAFAIYSSLVLGRSISILPQARRLVTSGPYKIVRHPLYPVKSSRLPEWHCSIFRFRRFCWILFCLVQHQPRVLLDASPEAVWKALRFYEGDPNRPGLLLLALLPRPVGSEGRKTQVGAEVRCLYDGGYLVKRITSAQPGQLLRFEVLEQRLGIENSVSMREGSYEIRPVRDGSQVLLTTHYHGHLRPRFLWRPFERSFGHAVHRHILGGMSALLDASAQEARGDAGRLAPALGEPPSP